jgi:hypothetical protein
MTTDKERQKNLQAEEASLFRRQALAISSRDIEKISRQLREGLKDYNVAMTNIQHNRATGHKESNAGQKTREDHYASLRVENDSQILEIHTLRSKLSQIQQRYKDAEFAVAKLEKKIENSHGAVGFEDDTLSPEECGQFTQVLYDSFVIADRYEDHIQLLQQRLEAEENQTPGDESAHGKARAVAAAYKTLKEKLEKEKSACREHKAQLNAVISQERSRNESLEKTVEDFKIDKEKLETKFGPQGDSDVKMRKLLAERDNTIAQLQGQVDMHARSAVASNPSSPTRRVTRSQLVEAPALLIVENYTEIETGGDAGDTEEISELRRAITQREYEIQVLEASLARGTLFPPFPFIL